MTAVLVGQAPKLVVVQAGMAVEKALEVQTWSWAVDPVVAGVRTSRVLVPVANQWATLRA